MTTEPAGEKDKIDYICDRLESHEKTFGNSAVWYRRVFFWTSIFTLLLTGMITVIAGFQTTPEFNHQVQQDIILVLGAIATIVSGWGLFFSPKDSWLIYATSLNRLRALRSKIQFLKSSPSTIKSDEQFASEIYAEYQAIMDAHNKTWLALRNGSIIGDRDVSPRGP